MCRPTGRYWFPALPSAVSAMQLPLLAPTTTPDTGFRHVHFPSEIGAEIMLAALGGHIGNLMWSAIEDDFHVTDKTIHAGSRLLGILNEGQLLRLKHLAE
jgi:hypothetical protein